MYLWGTVFPRRVRKRYHHLPLSVIVVARDGEPHTEARLANLLHQDYPPELVEIIVVNGHPGDATAAIVESLADPRIRVIQCQEQTGYAQALNAGMENASNAITVFVPPGQHLGDNAFAELAAVFEDRNVGAVTGELLIPGVDDGAVGVALSSHGDYEKFLLQMESEADSVVGSGGAVYAIRTPLFTRLPAHTLLDDFVTLMGVSRKGFRVLLVRSVRAYEEQSSLTSQQLERKARRLAGTLQAFKLQKWLLNPVQNRLFFQMVSHSLTRLVAPYFVVGFLVSNIFLTGWFYTFTLVMQLLFYGTVLLQFTPLVTAPVGPLIRLAWHFVLHHVAAVIGLWVFLSGRGRAEQG